MCTLKSHYISAMLIISLAGLISCQTDDPAFTDGDYFPLTPGSEWSYQQWLSPSVENTLKWNAVTWKVDGDTTVEGTSYKKIVDVYDGQFVEIVRKEGSKYYGRHHELYTGFTHEYLFLDTEASEGDSWSYLKSNGDTKTEYIVKAKGATRTVEGVTYENVIELEVNYYDRVSPDVYEFRWAARHQYAKDVGEVYSYYPYPVSNLYGDLDSYLTSYHK